MTAPHPSLPLLVATTTLLLASATLALGEILLRRGRRIPGWDAIFWSCIGVVAVVFLASVAVVPPSLSPRSDSTGSRAPVSYERAAAPAAQRSLQ